MSTNWAKKNSISPFFALSRISSRLGDCAVVVAMRRSSLGQVPATITRERERADGRFLQGETAAYVRYLPP
jgi:hypothetical protein